MNKLSNMGIYNLISVLVLVTYVASAPFFPSEGANESGVPDWWKIMQLGERGGGEYPMQDPAAVGELIKYLYQDHVMQPLSPKKRDPSVLSEEFPKKRLFGKMTALDLDHMIALQGASSQYHNRLRQNHNLLGLIGK